MISGRALVRVVVGGFLMAGAVGVWAAGGWVAQPPMPEPRYAHGAVVMAGRIHVVGGTSAQSCSFLSSHTVYDPATGLWTPAEPMSVPRAHPGAVVMDGLLYVVGGTRQCSLDLASGEVYDPATNSWSPIAPMTTPRANFGIAAVNGRIFVFGGLYPSDGGVTLASVESYDPQTDSWTVLAPMPQPRRAMMAGAIDGIIYIAGGSYGHAPTADVHAYDPVTGAWSPRAAMHVGRDNAGVTVTAGRLFIAGGFGSEGFEASTASYNPASDTWTLHASLPSAWTSPEAVSLNGQVFVLGGLQPTGGVVSDQHLALVETGDVTAPVTSATRSLPNGNGWNNGSVWVSLQATDEESGVASLVYQMSGAQSGGATVAGDTASFEVANEGVTTITYYATDGEGNAEIPRSLIVRIDRTPPVLVSIADRTVEAQSSSGGFTSFTPSATDYGGSGVVMVTANPPGPMFPLGTTTVVLSALDAAGNGAAPVSFTVTVQDTTRPSLFTPMAVGPVEATGPSGASVSFFATATDTVSGSLTAVCTPPSGIFAIGVTTVLCSATDGAGNTATKTFDVTVHDTRPPIVSPMFNIVREATGPGGATVFYNVTANDTVDGPRPVQCTVPSGSLFGFGITSVSCTASDTRGNLSAPRLFTVTVHDTTAPNFGPVANVNVEATSAAGAIVSYQLPVAIDTVDGPRPVSCSPPPGSQFPMGSTRVSCSSSDSRNNTRFVNFSVNVEPALVSLEVDPRAVSLLPGETQQFVGTARFSDGSVRTTADPGGGGGNEGGGSPSNSLWSIEFAPSLDVSQCGLVNGGFSSQAFTADATGAVNVVWSPNTAVVRAVGTLTPESQFTATLTCTNGNGSPGSITATWAGPAATRFTGSYSLGGQSGSVVIKGWSSKPSAPGVSRFALGGATVGGKFYAIGGANGTTTQDANQVYDPATNLWSTAASMPTRREGMGIVALDGRIYAVGGSANGTPLTTVEVFDPVTNTWSSAPGLLTARSHFALVAANGRLFAIGGNAVGGALLSSVERFDPATSAWVTMAPLPEARAFITAGALGGGTHLVAPGGAGPGGAVAQTTFLYNVALNQWLQGPSMPSGISAGAGATVGNAFYVFGGAQCGVGQVFIPGVNGNPDGWALLASMPTSRSQFALAAIGDVIYAAGGLAADGSASLATFESYSVTPASHLQISTSAGGGNCAGQGGGEDDGPTWRMLDESVATIDQNGLVTALAPGQTLVVIEVGGVSCLTTQTCATLIVDQNLSGLMHGSGFIDGAAARVSFNFRIGSPDRGGLRRLDVKVDYKQRGQGPGRFEASALTSVRFSDHPGSDPGQGIVADTVHFSGSGTWNGVGGFTFQAEAADRGEPGKNGDLFAITVRDGAGTLVATVSSAIHGGGIQSQ
ncbi:MAG: kelch repeat-containing protein [Acidobacteriota bacterium]|nr:kelch repeat-containing protein [Acidobacteriota bacterium]